MILLLTFTVNRGIMENVNDITHPPSGRKGNTMITNETLNTMYADDCHATIAWRNALRADRKALEGIYSECNTPAETIDRAAAIMGIDRAREVVASLINRIADYDGRICRSSKEWAQTIPGALDAAAAERMRLYSDTIHPAHLDQLARACKDYTPADPEPDTTETTASPETETEQTAETETTETAEQTEREAWIADIEAEIRNAKLRYAMTAKRRVTTKCIRDAERIGAPTVRVGYCGAQSLLSGIEPDYYTVGQYGWNCDIYRIAGLTICTGYRGMVGAPAVLTAEYERKAAATTGPKERNRLLAEWIAANLDAIQAAREGARA